MRLDALAAEIRRRSSRLPAFARRAPDRVLDLVFPPVCACCQIALDEPARPALCGACRQALAVPRAYCRRCGASLAQGLPEGDCPHCRQQKFRFDGVVRLGSYEGLLRQAVLRGKRPQERGLVMALGQMLTELAAARLESWRPEVVVSVPMHWLRRTWRGANSPQTIAEPVAARLGVPLRPELLARSRRTAPQANLSPNQRRRNVRGAFRAASHPDLAGARVLLVDDILTTGATLNEAAKTLRQAGAEWVFAAVVARAD